MKRFGIVAIALSLIALSGCGPIDGKQPAPVPDHKVAEPANGIIEKPVRPKGMPGDSIAVNWHVIVVHRVSGNRLDNAKATVKITATSPNAPVQGNVHGGYPFSIYTQTPYTHTIWFQPGIIVNSELSATIEPFLGPEYEIECQATSSGHDVAVREILSGGESCISSLSTDHL